MKQELLRGSRSRILAAAILIIAAVFVIRLFYLQVIQHGHYTELARAEQQSRFEIPATRGVIYAKNGDEAVKLVMNQTVYTVFADPVTVTEKDEIVQTLKDVAGANLRDGYEEMLDNTDSRYQVLATKLTTQQRDMIAEKNYYGIGFQAVSQRVYPEGDMAGQLLGFVNAEGDGAYGIEGYLDEMLKGTDGLLQAVTDVRDVPLTIGDDNIRIEPQDGANVVLTIDRNIQSKVEDTLEVAAKRTGADEVSAVIMDPDSGEVMAMANYPSYDPAEYYAVDDAALFNNNTISGPYEPGSTVKTLTMSAAVDTNVARPSDTFVNTDSITIGDRTISNAYKGITGTISFQTAMQWSLNTGFVTLAQRMGNGSEITYGARETMYEYYHDRFRLGQQTGIELANEATGTVVSPEQGGNAVRYSNMSFGQGMESTMIQVASAFSSAVNGGLYYQPTVIDGFVENGEFLEEDAREPVATDVVSANTSATLRQMLYEARQAGFPGADKAGYTVGGKTGTSQVIRDGAYSDKETIASYVGFGGRDDPEYVIMVQVSGEDKIFGGAQDALPIFTELSNWMISYLKLSPKG